MSSTHGHNAMSSDDEYVHSYEGHPEPEHGTLKGYLIGFVLAAILTVIPFWLVMGDILDSTVLTIVLVLGLGAAQILVHIVYFLHMNSSSEGGWNLMSLLFTLVIFFITLAGALWVMYNMNANMMNITPEQSQERVY